MGDGAAGGAGRLEAAETVIGQFIDAERTGQADEADRAKELEWVKTGPGAGGMLLVLTTSRART